MRANHDAFRAFLKSGPSQKTGVMGVTGVMPNGNNNLARYTNENESVTGVMSDAGHVPVSPGMDERRALAEIEGGIPALYSAGFARLQLTPPPGLSVPRWFQAVDDAGRFLDAFGQQAQAMGWPEEALFRSSGLIRSLQGTHVIEITSTTAVLSDGRTFKRNV